jgi:Holliday junction DNA helicase RuvA
MFNSIRGIVTGKRVDSVFLLTGGVEWDLSMPSTDSGALAAGEEARIFTWLYHREDQMRLFGFADEMRRNTFLELLKVEGIGPRAAVKIMGGIGQEDLERALESEDLARLEMVPGLGKKTAQKMILALKGKIARSAPEFSASSPHGELAEALVQMGYERRAAEDALAKADAALDSAVAGADREKTLFREAIVYLSGQTG